MRGFFARNSVETALEWISQQTASLSPAAEVVPLDEAAGRVLATEIATDVDVPAFDRSAMDGYALRGDETTGAGNYNPLPFRILGSAWPGAPFAGEVTSGSAVRIMTGAPLPRGADAVLPFEFAHEQDEVVEALAAVPPGKNIGRRGEDVSAGSVLLTAGRRLRPQDIAILASIGVSEVAVLRKPRVQILITGNELVRVGEPRGEYQIFDSNSPMLRPLIDRDGGIVMEILHLRDERDVLRNQLVKNDVDVVLISGGSSIGAEDHAPTILADEGELAIHGLAMRPSSPAGMGRIGRTLVFLLPGNPVSCLCAYDFFAGRAIRKLAGRNGEWPYPTRSGIMDRKLVSAVGRVDYARVRFINGRVEPLALSGASILSSTVRADGFVIVPAECEGYPPGAEVTVYLYDLIS